jgi:hypothetical protein
MTSNLAGVGHEPSISSEGCQAHGAWLAFNANLKSRDYAHAIIW